MSQSFYTWGPQKGRRGTPFVKGRGAFFRLEGGEEVLDMGSLSYQANLGHSCDEVVEAICKQARELCVVSPDADFKAKRDLARELVAMAPEGFGKVFFTLGGSEAVENAMKMAKLVTGRHKFVSRYRSYHGATMGALSLTGDYRRPPLEPGIPGIVRLVDDCADTLEKILHYEDPQSVAAIVLEPIPGANGVLIPPPGFWKRVRELCDTHGILLVADEVLTGFGRTGRGLAIEHEDVIPDIVTLSKGITGGYAPLGAVLVQTKLAQHFDDKPLFAGLTNYAHPIGCAAGLAAIRAYRDRGLYERAEKLGALLMQGLTRLQGRFPGIVSGVRGRGLLAAFDLQIDADSWSALARACSEEKVFVHLYPKRNLSVFSPPLVIDESDLEEGVSRFTRALGRAAKENES